MPPVATSYVCTIDAAQAVVLQGLMAGRGWVFDDMPYARWRGRLGKTTVVAYESGKLTVQGRETAEFVQFLLEPEILHEARFGYEAVLAEVESPEQFGPHAGIDESGKGDYFGPLVVACAYTDEASAKTLLQAGVADSKTIKSDKKIAVLADLIRRECADRFSVVAIGPETYNRMYASFGNLNRLLAWGHARALENLLEKVPDCPRALADQFAANENTVLRALGERGKCLRLEQRPRAEADVAVAAASILARAEFVRRLAQLGDGVGVELPKGASAAVLACAKAIAAKGGRDALAKVAKMHFKTTLEALPPL
ncbi:MAG: ribonuclease HIII [Lentisphaerae bacterium]|nr:ribonuclease HIII [Lentisphaerota bacterium]